MRRNETRKTHESAETSAQRGRAPQWASIVRMGLAGLAALTLASIAIGISDVVGSSGQPRSVRVEKEVSALLSNIPQSGDTLGQPSAPITLQIFGDLESADVRTFVVWLLPDIIREWVRTDIVKIQYRSFMTASSPYPNVFVRQQTAALAAGQQGRLWNFIETFYHEQGREHTRYVTEAYLSMLAAQVPGLGLAEWEDDRESSRLAIQVIKDDHAARAIGFPDAPVFRIGRTGGKLTPWPIYRLYEEPGLKRGSIKRPVHPISFITSHTLKEVIEHLP